MQWRGLLPKKHATLTSYRAKFGRSSSNCTGVNIAQKFVESWGPTPFGKGKGKASSLDMAPLTILDSGALQPQKWHMTGNDCIIIIIIFVY